LTTLYRLFWGLLWIAILTGCTLQSTIVTPQVTAIPVVPVPLPTDDPPPLTDGWEVLAPGLERRVYSPSDDTRKQFIALRIDPARYTFKAQYRPGEPLRLNQWLDASPTAVAVINANFYDTDNTVLGLLVADGVVYGQSYSDRGGRLVVQNGVPSIVSNTQTPYTGEFLEQAVQAFPMLVLNGQQAYTAVNDQRIARRTALGQDSQGRIILMATPSAGMTLLEFSAYLPTTDMNLVNAFNLDGGGSTMMGVRINDESFTLNSFDPVPAVLAVYPR
jgi:uncharacterized protein YigE (DUF2233 family)